MEQLKQLSLFPKIGFYEAMDHYQRREECKADIRDGYMTKFDKPVGMRWDVWYDHILEEKK